MTCKARIVPSGGRLRPRPQNVLFFSWVWGDRCTDPLTLHCCRRRPPGGVVDRQTTGSRLPPPPAPTMYYRDVLRPPRGNVRAALRRLCYGSCLMKGPSTLRVRLRTLIPLCLGLAAPVACGPRAPAGGPHPSGCQQTITWGGWDGTPECAGLAATIVSPAHRSCASDQDCALVGAGPCEARSVNNAATPRFRQLPAPCGHPLAGMCQPVQHRPVCQLGCCTAVAMRGY